MEPSAIGTTSSRQVLFATAYPPAAALARLDAARATSSQDELRRHVGEFVGHAFYGTLLRQMQGSKIKGKYLHGGRGEEVFQAQLNMEFARRLGHAPNDPIASTIYDALVRRLNPPPATPPSSRGAA